MRVRAETPTDAAAIRAVHEAAFPTSNEADLVDRLRADGAVVFSLVALRKDKIVGHVLFAKLKAPFRALGLAPVAALPEHQRTGVGTRIIKEGLSLAKDAGWEGVLVLGDPAYYTRFGFDPGKAAGFACVYAGPNFMAAALGSDDLPARNGEIAYPPAFAALGC